jgi:mono/diheme cytochrome c family protein
MRPVLRLALLAALVVVPSAAAAVPTAPPPKGTPARQGYALYGEYCIVCHGAAGAGIRRPVLGGGGALRQQSVQLGAGPSLRGVGALAADFYHRTG